MSIIFLLAFSACGKLIFISPFNSISHLVIFAFFFLNAKRLLRIYRPAFVSVARGELVSSFCIIPPVIHLKMILFTKLSFIRFSFVGSE
jgi:hypothetical protein